MTSMVDEEHPQEARKDRCISGAIRSTPNGALNAILSIPNPTLAGIEEAKVASMRLRAVKKIDT